MYTSMQAHAMTPHMGAGAGQGIEDVYLLSQLLTHTQTTQDNIPVRVNYFLQPSVHSHRQRRVFSMFTAQFDVRVPRVSGMQVFERLTYTKGTARMEAPTKAGYKTSQTCGLLYGTTMQKTNLTAPSKYCKNRAFLVFSRDYWRYC